MVTRYEVDRSPCRVDLSDNTNGWGMPPAARTAIAYADASSRYPSPYADDLKHAIAGYTGVSVDMVATGCGSDDVLDATIRGLGRPGDALAFVRPTFAMVPTFAELNGLTAKAVPFAELARCGARLIYLCSPNNPTGALTPRTVIEQLLDDTTPDQVLIVDEAYVEFSGSSVADLVRASERLVITRTMSKAFGLAGLRVGYALADPRLLDAIEAARGPFKVSSVSERAAIAALGDGREWMEVHAARAVRVRERLAGELRARGLAPLDSAANFVFVPLPNAPAAAAAMLSHGVRVRAFADPAGLRITVGPWPQMAACLGTLDEVLACA